MGLDLLDVTFGIEKTFHVEISKEEFFGLMRNDDIVVGDLYELLLKKMNLRDEGRNSVRLNQYLWSEVRQALHSATAMPIEQIGLGLTMETLFPRETRRCRWMALREACRYRIRELDYPRIVRVIGLLLATAVVVIELWQIPGAQWFLPLLGVLGVWMVGETYAKLLPAFAAWRNRFPSGMTTAKDLCRIVLATNYQAINNDFDISVDQRSSAVWEQLVELLAAILGVDPAEVTFRSRLVRDLGAE